jgi:hypothetical protein
MNLKDNTEIDIVVLLRKRRPLTGMSNASRGWRKVAEDERIMNLAANEIEILRARCLDLNNQFSVE